MSARAAITVQRPRDEVERLWRTSEHRPEYGADAAVTFKDAPGDRGTEIHVDLDRAPLAQVKDDLRRFKQHVETGVIVRSDATAERERVGG
jgi:uncharacterized membrane protein